MKSQCQSFADKLFGSMGLTHVASFQTLKSFDQVLSSCLTKERERVEADDGYVGEAPVYVRCQKCSTNPEANRKMQQRMRTHHKTVKKCFKQWGCLYQKFRRHDIPDHAEVFRAVTVITQVCISHGETLFQVPYSENP
jgi:hypothetical protein